MEEHYKTTHETWNKIAQVYENKFMGLSIYNQSYDAFLSGLPAHANVLDVGCGPGNIMYYINKKRPDLKLTGIDVAENMIAIAQKHNPAAHFLTLDSRDVLQLNSNYHGIIIGFCVPYLTLAHTIELIKNCAQLLTPDGVLYLSFVEPYNQHQTGLITNSLGDRVYFYYHELETIKEALIQHQFKIFDKHLIDFPRADHIEKHTILISRKSN